MIPAAVVRWSGDFGTLPPLSSCRDRLPVDAAFGTEEDFGVAAAGVDNFTGLKERWDMLGVAALDASFCATEEDFGVAAAGLDGGTFGLKEPWGLLGVLGARVAATFESGTSSNGRP